MALDLAVGAGSWALNNGETIGRAAAAARNLMDDFSTGYSSGRRTTPAKKRSRTGPDTVVEDGYQAVATGDRDKMVLYGPHHKFNFGYPVKAIFDGICPLWKWKHSTTGAYSPGSRGRQTVTYPFVFHDHGEIVQIFGKLSSSDVQNNPVSTSDNLRFKQFVQFCGANIDIHLASRGDVGVYVDIMMLRCADSHSAANMLNNCFENDIINDQTYYNVVAPISDPITKATIGMYPGKRPGGRLVRKWYDCMDHQRVYIKEGQTCTYKFKVPAATKSVNDWRGLYGSSTTAESNSTEIAGVTYCCVLIHRGEKCMNTTTAEWASHQTALEYQYDITEYWRRPPPYDYFSQTITGSEPTGVVTDWDIDPNDDARDNVDEL